MSAAIAPIRASEGKSARAKRLALDAYVAATKFDEHYRNCSACLRPKAKPSYRDGTRGRPWCLIGCDLKDRELAATARLDAGG